MYLLYLNCNCSKLLASCYKNLCKQENNILIADSYLQIVMDT